MLRIIGLTGFIFLAQVIEAAPLQGRFASIDGGEIALEAWRGRPVLVVNTASPPGRAPGPTVSGIPRDALEQAGALPLRP